MKLKPLVWHCFGHIYRNGFQKLEKIKDSNRQSRQLEELTDKMRDCKRYISHLVLCCTFHGDWHILYVSFSNFRSSSNDSSSIKFFVLGIR